MENNYQSSLPIFKKFHKNIIGKGGSTINQVRLYSPQMFSISACDHNYKWEQISKIWGLLLIYNSSTIMLYLEMIYKASGYKAHDLSQML